MGKEDIPAFLNSIPNDKLCNWSDGVHIVYKDKSLGYRLDHQDVGQFPCGYHLDLVPQMNKDGTHRIYIEPIAGSKSRHSKMLKSNSVLPQTHVTSPGVAQNVRDALNESVRNSASLVIANTQAR